MFRIIKTITSMVSWGMMVADYWLFQDVSREIMFGVTAILLLMPDERWNG